MKRSLINLMLSGVLLAFGWIIPHSVFNVSIETATPAAPALPTPTLVREEVETSLDEATSMPAPAEEADPYGEVYFTIIKPQDYPPGQEPAPEDWEFITRLARLPGSCMVGLVTCPAPELVATPFNMRDVLSSGWEGMALKWSPDGRYGLLVVHPQDDTTRGWQEGEWEKYVQTPLEELDISASTLYLFDAEEDRWSEIYTAERKSFHSVRWSHDGEWIAFTIAGSLDIAHPAQEDDGIYVIRADGSGLKRISAQGNGWETLGWVGDSVLIRRALQPGSRTDFSHAVEKLSMDGEVTTLFESTRLVIYMLAPDGGSLLAADSATREGGNLQKSVDVLALDGSVIRAFGTFSNESRAISPAAWSPDGTQVAFANLRRMYVVPRVSTLDVPPDTFGIPPDAREVYVADDRFISPDYMGLAFSRNNKYLLMEVYEGVTHFVVVSMESGQATVLDIPHLDPLVWDDNYLGDISFFSWRQ